MSQVIEITGLGTWRVDNVALKQDAVDVTGLGDQYRQYVHGQRVVEISLSRVGSGGVDFLAEVEIDDLVTEAFAVRGRFVVEAYETDVVNERGSFERIRLSSLGHVEVFGVDDIAVHKLRREVRKARNAKS